jgi:hypothetical protein
MLKLKESKGKSTFIYKISLYWIQIEKSLIVFVFLFFFLFDSLLLSEHMSSLPVFSGVRVTRSLVLCVMLCRSLFVPLSFLFWPLCCLSFFGFYRFWLPLWEFKNVNTRNEVKLYRVLVVIHWKTMYNIYEFYFFYFS